MKFTRLLEFMVFQSIWKGVEMITTASLKFISSNLILWIYLSGTIVIAVYMVISYIKHPSKRFAFSIVGKIFPKRYDILSANMTHTGQGTTDGKPFLIWDLDAKVHINTTKPTTIVFKNCTAELKHKQYPDIQSEFLNIMMTEEGLTNNKMDVFGMLTESKFSQITIDRPSTVMLLSRFTTSDWKPGDKESLEVLFELPVSGRGKPIKISVEMSNIGGGMDFATIT